MGYTPVKDRFHTRYSPVRRSPSAYCYAMLPLDLHVLSLSLAFILSQDQTLHGMNFICFFFLSRRPAARLRVIPDAPRLLLVFLTFQYLKELFLLRLLPRPFFRGESGCKDKHFLPSLPNFPATFFKVFSKTPLCHAGKTGTPSTIPLQAVHVLMPPSESGCKSTPSRNIFQIFPPLFSKKINTATIKHWNTTSYNCDRQYACKQAGDKTGGGLSPPASVLLPACSLMTLFGIYFHPCIYEYFSIIVFINESS